jgi:hypothetical protein
MYMSSRAARLRLCACVVESRFQLCASEDSEEEAAADVGGGGVVCYDYYYDFYIFDLVVSAILWSVARRRAWGDCVSPW